MRWTPVRVGCLVAAAIAASIYGWTLAPGVGAGDSGELILAARDLGIPHPPGYPIWVLLARIATVVPIGSVALRVNALSAFLSAVGAGLFYLLASRVGLPRIPRVLATALFAGSTVLWQAAVEAEVYALAIVAFLAIALLAHRARSSGTAGPRADALFFFACGLSLIAHQTLLFPAAALGAWVLARDARPRRFGVAVGWAVLGFSVALVLPLRSAAHPGAEWRAGMSLADLANDLLRRNYGTLRQNPFRLDLAVDELVSMGGIVGRAVGVFAAGLGVLGVFLARRRGSAARTVLLAAATIPAALVALITFTPDGEHLAQITPFLAPAIAGVALLAGFGAEAILRRVRGRARAALVTALATSAAPESR